MIFRSCMNVLWHRYDSRETEVRARTHARFGWISSGVYGLHAHHFNPLYSAVVSQAAIESSSLKFTIRITTYNSSIRSSNVRWTSSTGNGGGTSIRCSQAYRPPPVSEQALLPEVAYRSRACPVSKKMLSMAAVKEPKYATNVGADAESNETALNKIWKTSKGN